PRKLSRYIYSRRRQQHALNKKYGCPCFTHKYKGHFHSIRRRYFGTCPSQCRRKLAPICALVFGKRFWRPGKLIINSWECWFCSYSKYWRLWRGVKRCVCILSSIG